MKSDYYIYAIVSFVDGRIYIGIFNNVEIRLKYHNSGRVFFISRFRLWKIFYKEFIGSRFEARKREKYLKSSCGKEFLKFILGV